MPRLLIALVLAVALDGAAPAAAYAQDDGAGETQTLTVRTSVKASGVFFRAPVAPLLFPDRDGTESLSRIRVEPTVKVGRATFEGAYEQRFVYSSNAAGLATLGVLPSQGAAPYRVRQLDWNISESSNHVWRQEIDRASARIHAGTVDVTVGRQAIGWGRGVMFSAVDLFAPFSPLEADREWRRGIDAARAEVKTGDRSSLEGVGAFGSSWDRSLVAARVRGYRGQVDIEVTGGRRARDLFGGMTTSAAVGDAELHGELAAFRIPDPLPLDDRRTIWKAVAGGSYRFALGSGLMVFAEYHYSGFGARRPEDVVRMLADPSFAERYLRGDTQILSRSATALLVSYEHSPLLSFSGQWVENPLDRSGVVAPAVTVTLNDRLSIYNVLYLGYGKAPTGLTLRSQYGATPTSLFVQFRMYL